MTAQVDMRSLMEMQDREHTSRDHNETVEEAEARKHATVVSPTVIFQNLRVASALALEINTGLGHSRGSVMNLAAQMCGSNKRTKRRVLADYCEWLAGWFAENFPDKPAYKPNPGVQRALDGS